MRTYKRGQVEEAISRATFPQDAEPTADLRTKLKRLLDTDRNLGRNPRSNEPEEANFAFFSDEGLGSGVEVQYSAYEAFALHIAFQVLIHGCPQALVVSILRRARPKLEPRHAEVLRRGIEPTPDMYRFLISASRRYGNEVTREEHVLSISQLEQFLSKSRGLFVMQIEIARTAWVFHCLLEKTEPKKRGRGSS